MSTHTPTHTHPHSHTEETHHADVESIQQVKGQGSNEIDKEPGGDVVNTDGAGVVHYLTRRAHKSSSKVQQNVCRGGQQERKLTAGNTNKIVQVSLKHGNDDTQSNGYPVNHMEVTLMRTENRCQQLINNNKPAHLKDHDTGSACFGRLTKMMTLQKGLFHTQKIQETFFFLIAKLVLEKNLFLRNSSAKQKGNLSGTYINTALVILLLLHYLPASH